MRHIVGVGVSSLSYGWIGKVLATEFGRWWRSVSGAARLFYDHLGLNVLISTFWYVFGFLPVMYFFQVLLTVVARIAEAPVSVFDFLIVAALLYAVTVVLAAPVTASAYAASYSFITREGIYIRDLFLGIGRYWKKAAGTMAVAALALFLLVLGLLICLSNPGLRWFTVVYGYLIAVWFMAVQYLFPFVVQQTVGVWKTLQRAALVALDNVTVSLLLLGTGLILGYLCMLPLVPFVLIYMGFVAAMHNLALIEILKKYDEPPDGVDTAG